MSSTASPIEPLKNRAFRTYWFAGLSANFGWQIQLVGASWLMIALGGTPTQVALVQTSVALPVMIMSLPGGALSDRFGQRAIILWAQSFLMIVSIILAAFAYQGSLTPVLLLTFTFLVGCGRALYYPGWQSMVFEFFERDKAPAAFAINTGNLNIARSVGPALGGAIVAAAGAFVAFVISALSNVSVLLVARKWPKKQQRHDLPPEPFFAAIGAGLRYIVLSPMLLKIISRSFIFNIAAISIMALLPLVARDILQGGPQVYGFLLGAFGLGAVSAAFLSQGVRDRLSLDQVLAIGFLFFSGAGIVLGLSTSIPLSMLASFIAGICWILVQVTFGSTNQVSSPRWVISRSIGIYQTFVFGGNAIGSFTWGVLADRYDTPTALYTAAGLMLAGASLGLVLKIRRPGGSGLDPLSTWVAPDINVDMVMKSGPIVTSITYEIRETDVHKFLTVMREKRRSRIRDGASRWTLSRDIVDPEKWIERFYVATWADAKRLHARRTVASGELISMIRKLHRGSELPHVQYELVRNPASPISDGTEKVTHLDH